MEHLPPEVLRHICCQAITQHVYVTCIYHLDRCSLSSLAQTCRTLHDPAIDVIWRELDSFIPILYTLPSDVCKITRSRNESGAPGRSQYPKYIVEMVSFIYATHK